jgi:predicted ATPase/DNA-binding winged helix-turn-helix (wHTH) protein
MGEAMTQTTWLHFGEFRLHPGQRRLYSGEDAVQLGSRAMDVLIALVRRRGEIASKCDVMTEVWGTNRVEENNLTTQIAAARRALGDAGGRRFIQTVPGRGYRFVGEIAEPQRAAGQPNGAAAPVRPPEQERDNLPLQCSSFIGRERELADIRARLASRTLVCLVGPGGVGKTRAAIEVAREAARDFGDGVLLLELAPLPGNGRVAELLCRLLGVGETEGRTPEAAAIAMLRRCTMLLVLDNCEHVLEGAAALADAILRQCPRVRILATSRQALGVPGEAVFLMPSLGVPNGAFPLSAAAALRSDAVQLFVERASDALGNYALSDEDAPIVATICRRLDGVPLAMELAAPLLRMLKPGEIAARLEDVFRLLTAGSRTALPRQQTLRATIDWSHSLLSPGEQIVLRRLAVFADGCTEEGARAVAGGDGIDPDEVFDLLSGLVAKSLMAADVSGRVTRYRMLETTRHYAAEKLAEAGERARARLMADYMLAVFVRAEAEWPTMATDDWLAFYGPETENLRCAIDWAFAEGAAALGVSLVCNAGAVAEEMSLATDLRRWTQAAMAHCGPDTQPGEWARVLYLHTVQQKRIGITAIAPERDRAAALFRQTGERVWLSRALRQTAVARAMPGKIGPEALAMLEEAESLVRDLAPHKDLAMVLAHIGGVYFLNADHANSRVYNERALAMRRALGDKTGMLASAVNFAELLFLDGETENALRFIGEAESEARRRHVPATLALILCNTAGYRLLRGDVVPGERAAVEALTLSRAIGQDYLAVMCLEHVALARALRADTVTAARLLGFVDAHYTVSGQTRERLEQAGHDTLMALLDSELDAADLSRLAREGAAWRIEQAEAAAQACAPED